jgi:membrane protein
MRDFLAHLRRAILRVVPAALTQAQAIAFVMFLSFFPVMLLCLGLLSLSGWSADPARELPASFQLVLPAGSIRMISEFLEKLEGTPWKLIALGLFGTFLFVTQAMANYVDGFAIVWQDKKKPSYLGRYRRAFKMVCLTIVPWLFTGILTVFGRELRAFLAYFFGGGLLMRIIWVVVYDGAALATAFLALIVMYHVARPHRRWRDQMPGALLATICWWLVTAGFSLYVRNMHYNLIYGSMAAVIGLMIWMYFVALVVMVGAAYNAVSATGGTAEDDSGDNASPASAIANRAVAAAQH